MSHSDYMALRWLSDFLRARRLQRPTGDALYTYACAGEELKRAASLLAEGLRPHEQPGRHLSAMFCMYAAEWLRTNYSGGPWTWDLVYGSVGRRQDDVNPRELARKGLGYWQRKVLNHTDRRLYLISVVLEGGLPLQVIRTGKGRFAEYLKRVLREANRYEARETVAPEIAAAHAGMLPSQFRHQALYALAGSLVCSVLACRDMVPERENPIVWLDAHRPDWRTMFPLPVDDADARALLTGLIRESASIGAKGVRLNTLVERILVPDGEALRPHVAFRLSGVIDAGALPEDVRADLGDARRARLHADERMGVDGPLALFRKEAREGGEVWVLEAFDASARSVPWPPHEPVRVRFRVDGKEGRDFVPPGGEALDDGVWVFDSDGDVDVPEPFRLVSCGSVRSRKGALWVSLPADGRHTIREGDLLPYRRLAGSERVLHRISAPVRLAEAGSDLEIAIRPAAETDGAVRLTVGGVHPRWRTETPAAVAGVPRVWAASADGLMQEAAPATLRWRAAGRGPWERWQADRLPFGLLEAALVREGTLAARLRFARFPGEARAALEPEGKAGGCIRFTGFEGAWIGPSEGLPEDVEVTAERAGDETVLRFVAGGAPPSEASVEVKWGSGQPVRLVLPFPVRGGGFVDAAGRWIPAGSVLPLDGLHGVRAKASAGGQAMLFADLQGGDPAASRRAFVRSSFEGETSMAPYRPAFLRLLSNAAHGIDASVRVIVQTGGLESRELRISRFDAALQRKCDGLRLDHTPGAAVEIVALPIANPAASEVPLERDGDVWTVPEGVGPGPWLVYGRIDGRHRVRPTVIGGRSDPGPAEGLARAVLVPNHVERQAWIDDRLAVLEEDPQCPDWQIVDGALDALSGRLPFAVWDTFPRMAARPYALQMFVARLTSQRLTAALRMEDEFAFMWATLPTPGWVRAFREVHRRRIALFEANGATSEQAEQVAGLMLDDTLRGLGDADGCMAAVAAIVAEAMERQGADRPSALPDQAIDILLTGHRQAAQRRNADERSLPGGDGFRTAFPKLPEEHLQYPEEVRPLFDAPFVAARIAASARQPDPGTFLAIRQCRDFDPAWFESAFPLSLAREFRAADRI